MVGDAWYGRGGVTLYESWLRQQCATLGTPVDFVPHLDRNRVAELLADSSAACFPSEVEALPTAVLEAMAAAVPVVCSEIPGIREVGGDAVLARPREDVEALADASRRWPRTRRHTTSGAGWCASARAYTWDRAASELSRV